MVTCLSLVGDGQTGSYIKGQTTEIDLGSRRYSWERRKDLISKYWRDYFPIAGHSGAMRVCANRNAPGYQARTHSHYSRLSTAFCNAFTDVFAVWAVAG